MKINWVLPEASQCGGIRVALQYANALTTLGHDVVCYVPKSGQHFGWKKIFFPKELLRMSQNGELRGEWFDNKFRFEYPVWINNASVRDADVTIATSWITSYWVHELTKEKGVKTYFIQGFETWGNAKYNEIVLNSYRLPFDERITVSTALHDRILKEAGSNSVIICNSVEECFLEDLEKPKNNITVGMPYREIRDDDVKNCALGIRVLLKIKEKYPEIKIATFGFKKPEGWNDLIDFCENPTREELVEFYRKTNIFYVPSLYEGWGLPAMEAMAQKNAVLASCSGLIQEVGIDNENCVILKNPADEEEAYHKISALIQDSNKTQKIGQNARKVISQLSENKSVKMFERVLLKAIENGNHKL